MLTSAQSTNVRLGKTNKAVKYQPSKWGFEDT